MGSCGPGPPILVPHKVRPDMCLGNGAAPDKQNPARQGGCLGGVRGPGNKEIPFKVRWKTMNLVLDAAN